MELPPLGEILEYIRIPKPFHSFATGKPFKTCITCEKNLLKTGTQYLIEKAIVKYPDSPATDVIFEYAMCLECAEKMRQTLSRASVARIDQFFAERTDLVSRREALLQKGEPDLDDWLQTCIVTGKPVTEVTEYQIYAHCNGQDMFYEYAPYMLSGEAIDEIQELLSPETKEVLDDFIDDYFGLPPELKELIKDRNLLLI